MWLSLLLAANESVEIESDFPKIPAAEQRLPRIYESGRARLESLLKSMRRRGESNRPPKLTTRNLFI